MDHLRVCLDLILDMFQRKHFSEEGTTQFTKEKATFMFFRHFLDDCEGHYMLGLR